MKMTAMSAIASSLRGRKSCSSSSITRFGSKKTGHHRSHLDQVNRIEARDLRPGQGGFGDTRQHLDDVVGLEFEQAAQAAAAQREFGLLRVMRVITFSPRVMGVSRVTVLSGFWSCFLLWCSSGSRLAPGMTMVFNNGCLMNGGVSVTLPLLLPSAGPFSAGGVRLRQADGLALGFEHIDTV